MSSYTFSHANGIHLISEQVKLYTLDVCEWASSEPSRGRECFCVFVCNSNIKYQEERARIMDISATCAFKY